MAKTNPATFRCRIAGPKEMLAPGEIKYGMGEKWLHRCVGCRKLIGLPGLKVDGHANAPTVTPAIKCPLCGTKTTIKAGSLEWS
jgi:DNA-directed RNA polymerase subunit RPC12/RpoP